MFLILCTRLRPGQRRSECVLASRGEKPANEIEWVVIWGSFVFAVCEGIVVEAMQHEDGDIDVFVVFTLGADRPTSK